MQNMGFEQPLLTVILCIVHGPVFHLSLVFIKPSDVMVTSIQIIFLHKTDLTLQFLRKVSVVVIKKCHIFSTAFPERKISRGSSPGSAGGLHIEETLPLHIRRKDTLCFFLPAASGYIIISHHSLNILPCLCID